MEGVGEVLEVSEWVKNDGGGLEMLGVFLILFFRIFSVFMRIFQFNPILINPKLPPSPVLLA